MLSFSQNVLAKKDKLERIKARKARDAKHLIRRLYSLTQHWIIKPDLASGRIVRRWTPGSPERNIGGKIKRDERGCKTIDIDGRLSSHLYIWSF